MRLLNPSLLKQHIEERAFKDIREGKICGVAVAVKQHGKTVYEGYLGSHSPESTERLPKNALFRLASMTKPVTAVAALLQMQRGLIRLDDPVENYLPAYAHAQLGKLDGDGRVVSAGEPVTSIKILHLLTHTSGIDFGDVYLAQAQRMTAADTATLDRYVAFHSGVKLGYTPGAMQTYSATVAFDILAKIIELTSGRDFPSFLKEELFLPLGMTDTTFCPSAAQWERMVVLHDRREGRSVVGQSAEGCVFADFPVTHPLGGAGLASTLKDYSAFAEFLLNEGKAGPVQLLDPACIRQMAAAQVSESVMPGPCRWGLGVRVVVKEGLPLPVGSFGWSGAYGSHFWVDPVNKITAVYMKNSLYDGGSESLTGKHFEKDVYDSF